MKFLVDNHLPTSLARHLSAMGHAATHVTDNGMERADDAAIWSFAAANGLVVVSKDEDFFYLANRVGDRGQLLWIRLGNCRKNALLRAIDQSLREIEECFGSGQRVVELK